MKPWFVTIIYDNGYLDNFNFESETSAREFMADKLKNHKEGDPRIIGVSFGERK